MEGTSQVLGRDAGAGSGPDIVRAGQTPGNGPGAGAVGKAAASIHTWTV